MNGAVFVGLLMLTLACSAPHAERPVPRAPPAPSGGALNDGQKLEAQPVSAPAPAVPPAQREPPDLVEGSRVLHDAAGGEARLVIRNSYLTLQYVFLGRELLGSVPPRAQVTFVIPPGAHRIVLSDSEDGHSNPKSLSEVFDSGYSYHYDVVVR